MAGVRFHAKLVANESRCAMTAALAVAQASPTRSYVIPSQLVRDLAVVGLLCEDRPSARNRLEWKVGQDFAGRLLARRSPRLY
jgi:hypothetical protein